jgi:uncharacterized UPF0160 family protein
MALNLLINKAKVSELLQVAIGVPDADFCHASGVFAGAKSKAGAIKMAELALQTL